jgi:hypothetical protein
MARATKYEPQVGASGGARCERLVEEHARSRGAETALVVGESRQPHFWWQILRLRWR